MQQAVASVGFDGRVAVEMRHRLEQMMHGNDLQPGRQARFLGVGPGHHQAAPGLARREGRRQHAANRTDLTGQRQFAQALDVIQGQGRDLHAGGQNTQGNRQVEPPAVLG